MNVMRHLARASLLAILVIGGVSLTPGFHDTASHVGQDVGNEVDAYAGAPGTPLVAYSASSGLDLVAPAWAQDAGPESAVPDAGPGEPAIGDLVAAGVETAGAIKAAIDSKTMTGLLTALSSLISLLILLLRKFGGKVFSNRQVVRTVALALGVLAGVLASVAGGVSWWEAVQLALSGPGALALHQSLKTVLPSKWAAAAGGS